MSDRFEPDIYDAVSLKTCVEKRLTFGAPGAEAMKQVIQVNRKYLQDDCIKYLAGENRRRRMIFFRRRTVMSEKLKVGTRRNRYGRTEIYFPVGKSPMV